MQGTPERERDWHNNRYHGGVDARESSNVNRFYRLARTASAYFRDRSFTLARESSVGILDLGCGLGVSRAEKFREMTGTPYTGVDISDHAIEFNTSQSQGIPKSRYLVSDANNLREIDDASMDVVIGSGVLHHLDTAAAVESVSRVLAPGGRALFFEPLGYNPAVVLFRRLTPSLRSSDEHPLQLKDIRAYRKGFSRSAVRYYALTSLLAAPVCSMENWATTRAISLLEHVDTVVCRIPGVRVLSWICVLELGK